jgi:SPP1 family predicted phage head-tail adaptor
MRAGQFDRRITIQRQSITQSDSGEEIVTWVDVATVWARKIENRGEERFASQQFIGHAVKTFQIRWSTLVAELTIEHRIVFDGRTFDITDIRELARREGIEFDCYAMGADPLIPPPPPEVPSEFSLDFSVPANSGYLALLEDI